MDPLRLARYVVTEAFRRDAVFVTMLRDGPTEAVRQHVSACLTDPALSSLLARLGDVSDVPVFVDRLARLAEPGNGPSSDELDLPAAMRVAAAICDDEPTARALIGLCCLAVLDGRPGTHRLRDYPYLSVGTARLVGLEVARWLQACGAQLAASALARLLREYLTVDPGQRHSAGGRELVADLRVIEEATQRHLRSLCGEVAWDLHAQFETYRPFVALLFFALGEPVRAVAIVGEDRHRPRVSILQDLVVTSVELVQVDPLLQAGWLLTLGSTDLPVPDDIRFSLRVIAQEINGGFKGWDQAVRNSRGMSLSQAYITGVLQFLTGPWDETVLDEPWWAVVRDEMPMLPVSADGYRSALVRLVELFSLMTPPGTPLPHGNWVSSVSGLPAMDIDDPRAFAARSLILDQRTSQRAQIGRSLAYDNSFYLEPWRRDEPVTASLDALEAHRRAALILWLTVVPPLREFPSDPAVVELLDRDLALMDEYRNVAFLATLDERPVYSRVYGGPTYERVLSVDASELTHHLMECDRRFRELLEKAAKHDPTYGVWRSTAPATVDRVRHELGLA